MCRPSRIGRGGCVPPGIRTSVVESRNPHFAGGRTRWYGVPSGFSGLRAPRRNACGDPGGHEPRASPPSISVSSASAGLTALLRGCSISAGPEPGQNGPHLGCGPGSVGSVAGTDSARKSRVAGAIGIAGRPRRKVSLAGPKELGFDAAIDYKAGDLRAQAESPRPQRH